MAKLFCFGFGYCAQALAGRLQAAGWQIGGTHRGAETVAASRANGVEAHVFAPGQPIRNAAQALEGVSHLLVSISPDPGADPVDPVLAMHAGALRDLPLAWIGYISSTVVYGDHDGAWVDEDSALRTTQPRGLARIAAEQAWRDFGQTAGVPVHLFRSAGIYGPRRNALETMRSGRGRRIIKAGQVTSRIHVDDIARVLEASIAGGGEGGIYNLADDLPCPQYEPLDYAARLLGLAPAPTISFDDLPADSPSRKFMIDNRRVSNRRIKQDLGVRLQYPTYKEGLDALFG